MELIDFNKPIIHNADSDELKFVVHGEFARNYYNDNELGLYLKLENCSYIDKIFISRSAVEIPDDHQTLIVSFTLPRKATGEERLKMQLQLQNADGTFIDQTEIVEICLGESIRDTSDEVKDIEPNRLAEIEGDVADLDKRVTALEEGGGGGGSDYEPDVCVKRVWLSYDETERIMWGDAWSQKYNKVTHQKLVNNTEHLFNNPDWIYLNIISTPIGEKTIQAIKNGVFVLRFDYPIKHNNHERQKPTGAGVRSFLYNFNGAGYSSALMNSLIFPIEDDIKINKRGEKYIHIQITFREFVEKMYEFIDDDNIPVQTLPFSEEDIYKFCDKFGQQVYYGIPYYSDAPESKSSNFNSSSAYRFQLSRNLTQMFDGMIGRGGQLDREGNVTISKDKLNPLYTIYAPILLDRYIPLKVISPFSVHKKSVLELIDSSHELNILVHSELNKNHRYTNCSPRFCIIDSNYQNVDGGNTVWLKKYPQSPVSIKTRISGGAIYDDDVTFCAPIVRIFITKQKQ